MEPAKILLGATATTLSSMKAIRMTGLSDTSFNVINQVRSDEIRAGGGFRWLMAWTGTIGNTYASPRVLYFLLKATIKAYFPMLIAPPITFAIFVAAKSNVESLLDVSLVMTLLSLLILSTQPLSSLLQKHYPPCRGHGLLQHDSNVSYTPSKSHRKQELDMGSAAGSEFLHDPVEMRRVETVGMPSQQSHRQVFQILNGSIGWDANEPILQAVNITFRRASLNVITGSVASGKSTILKTLVGEIPLIQGSMCFPSSCYAYCDQTP